MVYIWKTYPSFYIETDQEIDAEYWDGQIGETLDDFYDGKWVLLSDEQAAFHEANPDASLREVWNTELTPVPERTITDAKREKIAQIDEYDNSSNVNSFNVTANDNTISAWLTPTERANYKSSIDAAEVVGLETLSFYIGELPVTLPTQQAKLLLAQIQLYADQCFMVTKAHKAAVEALESIEDVDNYNYESGYPEKLTFTL